MLVMLGLRQQALSRKGSGGPVTRALGRGEKTSGTRCNPGGRVEFCGWNEGGQNLEGLAQETTRPGCPLLAAQHGSWGSASGRLQAFQHRNQPSSLAQILRQADYLMSGGVNVIDNVRRLLWPRRRGPSAFVGF